MNEYLAFERWRVAPFSGVPGEGFEVVDYEGNVVVSGMRFSEAYAIVDAHDASIARVEEALW